MEDRHKEASVNRGHRVYKSVWTPVVGEKLNLELRAIIYNCLKNSIHIL